MAEPQREQSADRAVEAAEAEIQQLVDGLNSLLEGRLSAELLVGCGAQAIPPLRRFLLHGRPSGLYQPRRWAVQALAQLGARQVLIEYLLAERTIADPIPRQGEGAVENEAARALSRWQDEETLQTLLKVAQSRALPGVIEALAAFRRPEVVPHLVAALEDDFSRPTAEEALRQRPEEARPALLQAAFARRTVAGAETPSGLRARRSALRLLAEIGVPSGDWPRLRRLLDESDPEIAVLACRLALQTAGGGERELAVRRLLHELDRLDWFLQDEARECLEQHFDAAQFFVEAEIARLRSLPDSDVKSNAVLRTLLALRKRATGRQQMGPPPG